MSTDRHFADLMGDDDDDVVGDEGTPDQSQTEAPEVERKDTPQCKLSQLQRKAIESAIPAKRVGFWRWWRYSAQRLKRLARTRSSKKSKPEKSPTFDRSAIPYLAGQKNKSKMDTSTLSNSFASAMPRRPSI